MDRRNFLSAAGLGLAASTMQVPALAAAATLPATNRKGTAARRNEAFPKDFWWGAATAAYQLEGAVSEDGRKPSIWDTFSHTPGRVHNGENGDIACDHYHRFKEDVKLMADLGVKHYRFSLSWPRILPDGRGAVNEKGVDFYKRLVEELHRNGITPHATLYHWDLPQALQDRYRGWESREIVDDFADYATVAVQRLGDGIPNWITLNEIASFALIGYGVGTAGSHAPGIALSRPRDQYQVLHHALLAHGRGCQAIRAAAKGKCHVAIADNFIPAVPVIETPEHIEAARLAFTRSDWNIAITPLLTGKYDPFWLEQAGAEGPVIRQGDMELIHQKLDGLGYNSYTGSYVKASSKPAGFEFVPLFENYPKMGMPWLNHVPESIYWGIRMISDALGQKELPIFISENGCADSGPTDAPGEMQDIDRVMYLRSYMRQVQRAMNEGYPVVGYFPWSLMDNFEWAAGYGKRFGFIHVDYKTQKRTPKLSYRWYQETIRRNRIL